MTTTEREEGFIKDQVAWEGGWVHSRAYCLKCDNPSPMTYTGTNTWIALGPTKEFPATTPLGASFEHVRKCLVVDPGPSEHVPVILSWCAERNLSIGAVITTHYHDDHTQGAQLLADQAGVEWLSWERGNLRAGILSSATGQAEGSALREGASWPEDMPVIEVVHLPGHSPDSVGLIVEATMCMITGDVLFSQGPTVIKHPDGNLSDYLASLDVLEQAVTHARSKFFLTAHGYPIRECKRIINATRHHRSKRLADIKAALERGVKATPEAIVDAVYEGLEPGLRPAALMSAAIQLEYLGA